MMQGNMFVYYLPRGKFDKIQGTLQNALRFVESEGHIWEKVSDMSFRYALQSQIRLREKEGLLIKFSRRLGSMSVVF